MAGLRAFGLQLRHRTLACMLACFIPFSTAGGPLVHALPGTACASGRHGLPERACEVLGWAHVCLCRSYSRQLFKTRAAGLRSELLDAQLPPERCHFSADSLGLAW
eukprot:11725536-Alexandrium_andersonii.AAC.1